MKIRTGFVSNSSSSSFVIASEKKLTKTMIRRVFEVPKKHPLHKISEEMINLIFEKATLAEESDDWRYWEDEEKERILKKGKFVYTGFFEDFGNGGDEVESMLCWMTLKIKDKDFTMEHDGGY